MKKPLAIVALFVSLSGVAHAALTLQQIGDSINDAAWVSRIRARVGQAAPAIVNESVGTPNHAARLALAKQMLVEPNLWASRFAPVVAGQPGPVSANSLADVTDAQITTALDSLIDSMALALQ